MFLIRRAALTDVAALVELRVAFLEEVARRQVGRLEVPSSTLREVTYQYFLDRMPGGDFLAWLAETEERIVGTSGLVFFQRPPTLRSLSGLDAYVMNMYTVPEWRGIGVASALLQQTIDHARAMGAKRIWLHATEDGRRLYEKAGFTHVHDEMEMILE
jgi:GNAT superfamily N-acetyltransferase